MSGQREFAKAGGRFGPFPQEWGVPRGAQDSAERATWVRQKVIEHGHLTPGQQAEVRLAQLASRLRLAVLDERRESP